VNDEISIYPNPAASRLYIDFQHEIASETQIELFEISGKVLHSETLKPNSTSNHSIDLTSFEAGIYLIRISNNEYNATQKIIKVE
jgi:extracellular elastinolytic metalloproteinase